MSDWKGAHVEIIDPGTTGDNGALTPWKVLVNGIDVGLVAKDGVKFGPLGTDHIFEVTLTLFPSRVTIRGAEDESESQRLHPRAKAE